MIIKCSSFYYKLIFWSGSLKQSVLVLISWNAHNFFHVFSFTLVFRVMSFALFNSMGNSNTCESFVFRLHIFFGSNIFETVAGYMWWDTLAPSKQTHILEISQHKKVNSHFRFGLFHTLILSHVQSQTLKRWLRYHSHNKCKRRGSQANLTRLLNVHQHLEESENRGNSICLRLTLSNGESTLSLSTHIIIIKNVYMFV